MGWQVVYVPFLEAGGSIINQAGLFVYSSTPANGNLIASIASVAGVDNFGNSYQAGTTSYLPESGKIFAVGLNTLSGTGLPGLSIQDIANLPTAPAGFFGEASSNVSTPQAFAAIASGQANATDVSSFISVLSQLQAGPTGGQIVLQAGDVQIDDNGSLADFSVNATDGSLGILNNTVGDGDVYKAGHKVVTMASDQAITLTTPVIITNMQFNVATGFNYRFYFQVVIESDTANAGGLTVGFNGSSVSGNANGRAVIYQSGVNTPSCVIFDGSLAGFNTFSPAVANTRQVFDIEIWASFSTGGAFNLRAQLTAAGATYHIKSAIGWKEIAA